MIKRKGRIISESKGPEWVWVGLTARNFCRTYDKKNANRKDFLLLIDDTFENDAFYEMAVNYDKKNANRKDFLLLIDDTFENDAFYEMAVNYDKKKP